MPANSAHLFAPTFSLSCQAFSSRSCTSSSSPTRAFVQGVSAELSNKPRDRCAKTKPVCAQPGLRLVRLAPAEAKNQMSYFQPSSSHPQASPNLELPSLCALVTPKTPEDEVVGKEVVGQAKPSEAKGEKEARTSLWKSVLGAPCPRPSAGATGSHV